MALAEIGRPLPKTEVVNLPPLSAYLTQLAHSFLAWSRETISPRFPTASGKSLEAHYASPTDPPWLNPDQTRQLLDWIKENSQ